MSSTRTQHLAFALAATFGATGCLGPPPDATPVPLSTHVGDWRDEVIYQVMVDRFANGDPNNDLGTYPGKLSRYQGGDWRGLADKLDYLDTLGVTTVWISPVVRNVDQDADFDGYHGYWAQNLSEPNAHFGDITELRRLVRLAHERNMKVVLDIVTNHMGQVFFYDQNLNGRADVYIGGHGMDFNGDGRFDGPNESAVTHSSEFDPDFDLRGVQVYTSLGYAGRAPLTFFDMPGIYRQRPGPGVLGTAGAYHGNGRTLNYDDPDQLVLGDFPGGLKDVATEVPEVRAAMVDAYARWVELVDLDGFRIDTVKHVEHEFWQVFARGIRERLAKQGKQRFLMFGEAFDGRDDLLGSFTRPGELDSVFYFSQRGEVFASVFENAHDPNTQGGTQNIESIWRRRLTNWSNVPQAGGTGVAPSSMPVNFLDNHDVARFLCASKGDVAALRNALTLLLTEEGLPCLYYGTEQDFSGGNDPANREVMWTRGFDTTGTTFTHFARLAKIRRESVALRRGATEVVYSTSHTHDEPDAGLFAFERKNGDAGDRYALVMMNTNARNATQTEIRTTRPEGSVLVEMLGDTRRRLVVGPNGALNANLPAQSALILIPEDQLWPES